MDILEVTITIKLQVRDTNDKLADCLAAMDAARALLNNKPGYELLRTKQAWNGGPLVTITKLRRLYEGGVVHYSEPPAPLSIDAQVEE